MFEATPGQAPAIIQTLEDAVKDRDEWVGSSAREALAKMIKAVPCEAAAIIHRLEDAVKDR